MKPRYCMIATGLFLLQFTVGAEVLVSALDTSSQVLFAGDAIELKLNVHNVERIPFGGVLSVELTDPRGRVAGAAAAPVYIAAGVDQLATLNPTVQGVGYFSVNVIVKQGETTVFDRDTVWSIAVFDRGPETPADSPFGTYIIGNTGMLSDIVPKGFFADMARGGARWGTLDTWWSLLEVEEGKYNWNYYDEWFEKARAAGIMPIPHLFGIPKWISSQPDKENYWAYPPRDWLVWERFVEDFVKHHQTWLAYLRIWNEPNCGYWQGTPADYAQMVIHASQAAKRVKPDIKIIIEAVANTRLDVIPFFNEVDAAGATPYWDILAVHNYWLNHKDFPERTSFIKTYRDVIDWRNAHKPGAEVWDTEFACMADDWGTEWFGVGETKQAQWLARAHVLGLSLGLTKMFWFPGYSWPDPTMTPYYNPSGLLRPDLSPRPAFVAYHTITSALSRARYEQSLSLGADQYGVVFKTPEGFMTALWSVDAAHGGAISLKVGNGATVIQTTLMGEQETLTAKAETGILTVTAGENMILLSTTAMPAVAGG